MKIQSAVYWVARVEGGGGGVSLCAPDQSDETGTSAAAAASLTPDRAEHLGCWRMDAGCDRPELEDRGVIDQLIN